MVGEIEYIGAHCLLHVDVRLHVCAQAAYSYVAIGHACQLHLSMRESVASARGGVSACQLLLLLPVHDLPPTSSALHSKHENEILDPTHARPYGLTTDMFQTEQAWVVSSQFAPVSLAWEVKFSQDFHRIASLTTSLR